MFEFGHHCRRQDKDAGEGEDEIEDGNKAKNFLQRIGGLGCEVGDVTASSETSVGHGPRDNMSALTRLESTTVVRLRLRLCPFENSNRCGERGTRVLCTAWPIGSRSSARWLSSSHLRCVFALSPFPFSDFPGICDTAGSFVPSH